MSHPANDQHIDILRDKEEEFWHEYYEDKLFSAYIVIGCSVIGFVIITICYLIK